MITDILIFALIVLSSVMLGANIGFNYGIKKGIDISMETAITETINHLKDEYKKMGMDDQFMTIVKKVFDTKRLKLTEEDNGNKHPQ